MCCWIDPFPLVHNPDGSESIAWLELAWKWAFGLGFMTIFLALFGKNRGRIFLIVSGALTLILAFGSLIQNGT
jgi:hypothetical protein